MLTGAATTYRVQADESNDASALERAVSPATDVLAASDSAVLGHSTEPSNHKQKQRQPLFQSQLSVSHSLSVSTSASESASTSASSQHQPRLQSQPALQRPKAPQPVPVNPQVVQLLNQLKLLRVIRVLRA